MTEQEWLICDDPDVLLRRARFRSYPRKSRLFAVACCRRTWHLFVDERSRHAVEVAERHADGAATDGELSDAAWAAGEAHREMFGVLGKVGSSLEWAAEYSAHPNPFHGAKNASWMAAWHRCYAAQADQGSDPDRHRLVPCTVTRGGGGQGQLEVTPSEEVVPTGADRPVRAMLLRCIFGNPFRRLTAPTAQVLAWNGGLIRKLAETAYDHRHLPFGDLDQARLAVLADALEEAGVTDPDLLQHLRHNGPHVRGCWAIDLLLGKGP